MAENPEKPAVMICAKKEQARQILDSEEDVCSECGCAIMVAPTGRAIQRRHFIEKGTELRLVCHDCGMKLYVEEGDGEISPIEPEQARELSREKVLHFWARQSRR